MVTTWRRLAAAGSVRALQRRVWVRLRQTVRANLQYGPAITTGRLIPPHSGHSPQDGLSYLFISHNLAVVEHVSHDVAVMYLGRIVEHTGKAKIFARPLHPYTQALMAAVPIADPSIQRIKTPMMGDVPSPINRPSGCHFHPRCPLAEARCRTDEPELREVEPGHRVACHLV